MDKESAAALQPQFSNPNRSHSLQQSRDLTGTQSLIPTMEGKYIYSGTFITLVNEFLDLHHSISSNSCTMRFTTSQSAKFGDGLVFMHPWCLSPSEHPSPSSLNLTFPSGASQFPARSSHFFRPLQSFHDGYVQFVVNRDDEFV